MGQSGQRRTSGNRKVMRQQRGEFLHEVPARSGIRQEEEQSIHAAVSSLDRQPPREPLAVRRASFRFDSIPPRAIRGRNRRVPRSLIAGAWERNLELPQELGVQAACKACEQTSMAGIAQRVRLCRVGPPAEVESYDGEHSAHHGESRIGRPSPLERCQPAFRYVRRTGDCALAQAVRRACDAQLAAEVRDDLAAALGSSIYGPLPGRHVAIFGTGTYRAITCGFTGS
jgi:hypothetical protein